MCEPPTQHAFASAQQAATTAANKEDKCQSAAMAARPDGDLEIMDGRAAASEQQCAACNMGWYGVSEGSHSAKHYRGSIESFVRWLSV